MRANIQPMARIGAAEFFCDVALRATNPNSAYLAVLALCYLTGDSDVGQLLVDLDALQLILSPPVQLADAADVMTDIHDFTVRNDVKLYVLDNIIASCFEISFRTPWNVVLRD